MIKFNKVFLVSVIFFFYIAFLNVNGKRTYDILLENEPTNQWTEVAPQQTYDIHLETEPINRWTEVSTDQIWNIQQIESNLATKIPLLALTILEKIAEYFQNYLIPPTYLEELQGIHKNTAVSLGLLILANLINDLNPHCVSLVAQGTDGKIWHGRNLDFELTHFLENSTIIVNFMRNNKTIYRGVTFAGYIGMLTAERIGVFTISLDERFPDGSWFTSLYETIIALFTSDFKMSSFAMRDSLENHNSYEEVVSYFTDVPLIAPSYFIIGGAHPGQGAIITRDRSHAVDVWKLSSIDKRWFLVETNYDNWKDDPEDVRRNKAVDILKKIGPNNLNSESLLGLLSTAPMHRSMTVYSIVMSAGDENVWSIRVWN